MLTCSFNLRLPRCIIINNILTFQVGMANLNNGFCCRQMVKLLYKPLGPWLGATMHNAHTNVQIKKGGHCPTPYVTPPYRGEKCAAP